MPVPTAVPPMFTTRRRSSHLNVRHLSRATASAKAENSAPSVIGTASCSSVLPIVMIPANCFSFSWSAPWSPGNSFAEPAQPHYCAHLQRCGVRVIRGLIEVHVLNGMNPGIIPPVPAEYLDCPVGNHLVHVHVGGGSRSALQGIHRELV